MQFSDSKNEGRQPVGVGILEAGHRAGLAGDGANNEFDYEYVLARIGRCKLLIFDTYKCEGILMPRLTGAAFTK